jgi:hypothetical protein
MANSIVSNVVVLDVITNVISDADYIAALESIVSDAVDTAASEMNCPPRQADIQKLLSLVNRVVSVYDDCPNILIERAFIRTMETLMCRCEI